MESTEEKTLTAELRRHETLSLATDLNLLKCMQDLSLVSLNYLTNSLVLIFLFFSFKYLCLLSL